MTSPDTHTITRNKLHGQPTTKTNNLPLNMRSIRPTACTNQTTSTNTTSKHFEKNLIQRVIMKMFSGKMNLHQRDMMKFPS